MQDPGWSTLSSKIPANLFHHVDLLEIKRIRVLTRLFRCWHRVWDVQLFGQGIIKVLVNKLNSYLTPEDKEIISGHIQRNDLYIRLDKQAAFINKLKLQNADPIHVRVHFRTKNQSEVIEAMGLSQ